MQKRTATVSKCKYKIINFDDVTIKNRTKRNPHTVFTEKNNKIA